jgi:hypothetical protein
MENENCVAGLRFPTTQLIRATLGRAADTLLARPSRALSELATGSHSTVAWRSTDAPSAAEAEPPAVSSAANT